MFFVLSKLLWFILAPTNLLVLLALVGVILLFSRFMRAGRVLVVCGVAGLALCAFTPLASWLISPMEQRFQPPAANSEKPTIIIVLGGGIGEMTAQSDAPVKLTQAGERMTTGVELARRFPDAKLVFTGGSAKLRQNDFNEANSAEKLWLSLGVPASRMIFERKSRNTFENAVFTRDLIKPGKNDVIWLVTSAWHMPRSVGIFRKAGMSVVAYPVDYRTSGGGRISFLRTNGSEELLRFDLAAHEWFGLVAYWLSGKTDALFPAP